jgi:hypothetical protein
MKPEIDPEKLYHGGIPRQYDMVLLQKGARKTKALGWFWTWGIGQRTGKPPHLTITLDNETDTEERTQTYVLEMPLTEAEKLIAYLQKQIAEHKATQP